MSSESPAGPRPDTALHRHRRRVLALASIGIFMTPLDGSIVSVALQPLARSLHLSYSEAIWVQAAYLLAISACLVPLGRLADEHGRVRFFLAGVLVFTAGSVASGLAPDAAVLIAARVVQGVGGALLSATAAALVTAAYPPAERGRALGFMTMWVYVGLTVGPLLGGLIVQHLTFPVAADSWRWIFYVNIPIGAATLLAGRSLLPAERRDREAAGAAPARSFDLAGAALLALALAAFIVPLTFGFQWGWVSPAALGLLATAVLAGAAFVAVEGRRADPVLDLTLLRHNRLFATANLAALLNYAAMNAVTVLTAVFLEVAQHRSPQVAGLMLISQPVLMAALSEPAGRLSDRIGTRALASGGMMLIAVGLVLLATMSQAASAMRVMIALAVVGLGMAAFSAPNTSAVMGAVERSRLGVAASFLATMRFTGQAVSVALLGGIAGSRLGPVGGKVIFLGARVVDSGGLYTQGFRLAMTAAAAMALTGGLVSLTRPAAVAHASPAPGESSLRGDHGGAMATRARRSRVRHDERE
jgi:EmrB/QacA subfamily drug resistance transporter